MGVEVNVRLELSSEMADYLSSVTGDSHEATAVAAYIADLIRRDMETGEFTVPPWHVAEVTRAFATPESEYVPFDAAEFMQEMKRKYG